MERIQKMMVKNGSEQITYSEDIDIIAALDTIVDGDTIDLVLIGDGTDGYLVYPEVEDVCIYDIVVRNGEVYYDPAE